MNKDKENQEISVLGRLLCMEALIFLMGLVSLGYGIVNGASMSIFFGVFILCGGGGALFREKERLEEALGGTGSHPAAT